MQLSLQPYSPKFKSAVLRLNALVLQSSGQRWKQWKETHGKDWDKCWNEDLNCIENAYLGSNGEFLLLFDGHRLVGFGGLCKVDEACAKVKRIRVHPDCQKKGCSLAIISGLEARANELGYKKLIADTIRGNLPAEKMLQKAGFGNPKIFDFEGVECTLFEKKLGQKRHP